MLLTPATTYLVIITVVSLCDALNPHQVNKQPYREQTSRTTAEKRKLLYGAESTIECGLQLHVPKTGRNLIVGGRPAVEGEFPWQVSFRWEGKTFCGGTIIGSQWILTAAHCHLSMNNIEIALGTVNLLSEYPKLKIDSVFDHSEFNNVTGENDIALVKTIDKIDLTGQKYSVGPACLPHDEEESSGEAFVSGFGYTKEFGQMSKILQVVEVPIVAHDKCKSYYSDLPKYFISPKMLCAGQGGKDACQGDSGGPLVQFKNKRGIVIGIVSWGHGCARPDRPGVYTKVSSYTNWIFDTIGANQRSKQH